MPTTLPPARAVASPSRARVVKSPMPWSPRRRSEYRWAARPKRRPPSPSSGGRKQRCGVAGAAGGEQARARGGELGQALARLAGRLGGEPHRREQCALGVGADDVAPAGQVPPLAGDSRGGGEPVEDFRLDGGAPARWCLARRRVRCLRQHGHRPGRDGSGLVRDRRRGIGTRRGQRRVEAMAPDEALARVRPAHRDRSVAGVERNGDAVGAGGLRGARVEDRHQGAPVGPGPVAVVHRAAIRVPPLDVGDAACRPRARR